MWNVVKIGVDELFSRSVETQRIALLYKESEVSAPSSYEARKEMESDDGIPGRPVF